MNLKKKLVQKMVEKRVGQITEHAWNDPEVKAMRSNLPDDPYDTPELKLLIEKYAEKFSMAVFEAGVKARRQVG